MVTLLKTYHQSGPLKPTETASNEVTGPPAIPIQKRGANAFVFWNASGRHVHDICTTVFIQFIEHNE